MSKVRAQTIQQRFGFKDDDLKSPKHDQLMLDLTAAADDLVSEIVKPEWSDKDIKNAKEHGVELPPFPAISDISCEWEVPIVSRGYKSKYIVGFADLVIACCIPRLEVWESSQRGGGWEREFGFKPYIREIYFEVKSTIPSLGELVRQINMYREYTPHYGQGDLGKEIFRQWAIVSPDGRFANQIAKLGFTFVKYDEPDTVKTPGGETRTVPNTGGFKVFTGAE